MGAEVRFKVLSDPQLKQQEGGCSEWKLNPGTGAAAV